MRAVAALLVLGMAAAARADTEVGPVSVSGEVTGGVRGVSGDDGAAKYEEYREQDPGVFGTWLLRADEIGGSRYLRASSVDAAERDQRLDLELGRYGRYALAFELDDLPHVYTHQARTLYSTPRSGAVSLPPGLQATLEPLAGAARSAALETALAGARGRGVELGLRTTGVRFDYWLGPDSKLDGAYRVLDREGEQRLGLGFGSPGGSFAELAAPVDDATREATLNLSLARERWSLDLGYTGSFYRNDLDSLVVANPLRATDSAAGGSSRGRVAPAPDNSAHTLALSGALALPVDFGARVAGTVSYSLRRQDEDFLPHTINGAITDPGLALPRRDLDGRVGVLALNLSSTLRPVRGLRVRGRYRLYDHDSRTDAITFPAHVISDQALDTAPRIASPLEYRRQNADLEAEWRVGRSTWLALGYGWEGWRRSRDRDVRHLREHTARVAVRARPRPGTSLRAAYEWSARAGSSYRPFAYLAETLPPAELPEAREIGQSPDLRRYDVSDRERSRLELAAQLDRWDTLGVTLTAAIEDVRHGDTDLGRTDERSFSVGADFAWAPREGLHVSGTYTYEDLRYDLDARFRGRRFVPPFAVVDDPLNDWSSDSIDRVHNGGLAFELAITDRLDARLAYGVQAADAETRAGGPAGLVAAPAPTSSGDGGNAVSYPDIEDVLQTLSAGLGYRLRDAVSARLEYRYERLDLRSFQTDGLAPFLPGSNVDGSGVVSPSADVFLGGVVEDYDAHVVELSLTYRF